MSADIPIEPFLDRTTLLHCASIARGYKYAILAADEMDRLANSECERKTPDLTKLSVAWLSYRAEMAKKKPDEFGDEVSRI